MEHDPAVEESRGVRLKDALLLPSEDGIAYLRLSNSSEFTSVFSKGTIIGEAVKATVVPPSQKRKDLIPTYPVPDVKKISTMSNDEGKRERLKTLEEPDLPELENLLCNFLAENHLALRRENVVRPI